MDGILNLLCAVTNGAQFLLLALRALGRHHEGMTAVVTGKTVETLVIGEAHIAV